MLALWLDSCELKAMNLCMYALNYTLKWFWLLNVHLYFIHVCILLQTFVGVWLSAVYLVIDFSWTVCIFLGVVEFCGTGNQVNLCSVPLQFMACCSFSGNFNL